MPLPLALTLGHTPHLHILLTLGLCHYPLPLHTPHPWPIPLMAYTPYPWLPMPISMNHDPVPEEQGSSAQ